MTQALRLGKKAFTVSVVVTTIAWSIGLAAFLAPLTAQAAVTSGDLIKASLPAVYYYGADGKRYVFPNEKTYSTWYSDFSSVKKITDDELAAITIGGNSTYKPGVKMVKITTDPKVYAVQKGGALRWVKTEAIAIALYGSNWNTMIEDIPDAFFTNYTIGAEIASASDFDKAGQTAAATSINVDKGLVAADGGTGGALTVALSSDTPISNSVLNDSGGSTDGAQALASFTKLTFTASSAGSVTVRTVKLHRTGISADTDFSNVYLYDGDTRLTESASFSSGYVTLNDASGLFTVPAGGSKSIMVKADIANSATSIAGKTFRFSLEGSADVTSDASLVAGGFPLVGNYMTGAQVTDLATLDINTLTTFPATIDPGVTDRELWRFNMVAANWDVQVRYIKLTVVGTVSKTDLTNIKLAVGGVQIGNTVTALNDSKEAIFDMTASPYVIKSGQTKTVQVMGDVVSGTDRAFKFTIQKMADVIAYDTNYSVFLKVNQADSFTLLQPETGDGTNINTGTLTITRHSASPTGNITRGLTGTTIAKFNFKSNGESIKITSLGVSVTQTVDGSSDLNNGKLFLDGVQVGTTKDLDTATADDGSQLTWADDDDADQDDDTEFTFGNSFVVPAGVTKVLEIVADIVSGTSSDLTSGNVITAHLNKGGYGATTEGTAAATNGQGQTSMATLTTTAADGLPLTVSTGVITVTTNLSFADKSATSPSGVAGGTSVKIGSFVITAGAGEGADVTQIVVSDHAYPGANDFQNLKLQNNGTQLGLTKGTLNSSSSSYTFTPSPALSISAGGQYVLDLYADVLTAPTHSDVAFIPFYIAADGVTATGKLSGLSATGPAANLVTLQDVFLSTGGSLTAIIDADSPVAAQLSFGETDVTFAKFRFQASSTEAVRVTELVVTDDMSNYWTEAATGTIRNLKLYNGSLLLGTVSSMTDNGDDTTNSLYAKFTDLNLLVAKGGSATLTIKADVSAYDAINVSSSRHRMALWRDYKQTNTTNNDIPAAVTDYSIIAWGVDSGTQLTAPNSLKYGTVNAPLYDVIGSAFDVFKSKLSIAKASDSPSGSRSAGSEDAVAIFTISNQSAGGYTARIRLMNFDINSSGFSQNGANSINVYKSSVFTSDNRLATSYMSASVDSWPTAEFSDSGYAEADFLDLDIAAGSSKNVYVTMDTSSAALDTTYETLSVGIASGMVTWDEDAYDATTDTYSEIKSLPLSGNSLSYN